VFSCAPLDWRHWANARASTRRARDRPPPGRAPRPHRRSDRTAPPAHRHTPRPAFTFRCASHRRVGCPGWCNARDPPSPCGLRRAWQVRPLCAPLPATVARHLAALRNGTDRRHVHRQVDGSRADQGAAAACTPGLSAPRVRSLRVLWPSRADTPLVEEPPSTKVALREGATGAGLQVALEADSCLFVEEFNDDVEMPGAAAGGMRASAGVVSR